ncbi:MAG: excinuclease ABC subunit C [Cenarchaeum symbiont of Oopsacas minuta]|nr:excinuclease ABC subunit C [Cenarchaeum symbiont of Oopsacas minuta]
MVQKNVTYNIQPAKIPTDPGVYIMKNIVGETIYVGKAKNLRNRVRTYFVKNRDYKTQKLVEKISDIEYVITDTEEEAFLLESNLIKRYRPYYNIELRDQQRYTYLRVTDEKYPRLLVARRTRSGKFLGRGKTYGPFTHGTSKLLTVGMLRKSFKVRICKTLPKKACLEYHIGNCDAPCEFASAQKKYAKHVAELKDVLDDGEGMVRYERTLYKMMREASNDNRFEDAIEIRETLNRLKSLKGRQNMERSSNIRDEDYIGIQTVGDIAHVMTLTQSGGIIRDRERFSYDEIADNTFSNFLYQYYTTHKVPTVILTNRAPFRKIILEKMLSQISGYGVNITTPTRGRRRQIMDLIMRNINLATSNGVEPAIEEMQKQLKLEKMPHSIECFDVSNHGADYAVGSMSRFVDGQPDKSGYRRFMIKTVRGPDDYAMISEIVRRRYSRLVREGKPKPDLVLIDGGLGQLGAAHKELERLNLNIQCVSLAKEREEVFILDKNTPIVMEHSNNALRILQYARDEAHRFGVAYNRRVRKSRTLNEN